MSLEITQSSKEKSINMTDEQFESMTDEEKSAYLANEIKKKLYELNELYKKSREHVYKKSKWK